MKIIKISFVNGLSKINKIDETIFKIYGERERSINFSESLIKNKEDVYKKAFESFREERVCFLGTDHSASYSTIRAFLDYIQNKGKEPCLIVFNARPNLMKPTDRRILTNEEWLRGLIEDSFPIKNILLVGVRKINDDEKELFGKIRKVTIEELMFDLENKTDAIMEFSQGRDLYISFDISVVDPAYAPGINNCEPGGLSSKEILYIVKRLSKMKNLQAIDLVGINPSKDVKEMTVQLILKILEIFSQE